MRKQLALIPALAALVCAAIMLYLLVQIDLTRKQLQRDGVLEFNFIQQTDHNFDTLAQTLMIYQVDTDPEHRQLNKKAYVSRFDVLYAMLNSVGSAWLGSLKHDEEVIEFLHDTQAFLARYDSDITNDVELNAAQLLTINREAIVFSSRIYNIGLKMFSRKSAIRDNISRRMNDLYDALWIFGLSFVLTSLLSIGLLVSVSRRAANLRADARNTQSQLTTALDELTTGDIERRAQNRFMASASHDLRQPLHALGLYLTALKGHIDTDQGHLILSNIHRSTAALNQLLNSMLDLSKLDAGVVDVSYTHLSLNKVFNHLHQTFLPEANQQELALNFQYSGLFVYSDQVLLERILGNLVSNALNYTDKGSVSISAVRLGQHALLTVSDTGPGIPKSEQEAVFNEYYQLNNPERDRGKGLGLGLSIVKRLTRLLDIELSIDSRLEQGTAFSLKIQLGSAEHAQVKDKKHLGDSPVDRLNGLSILVIDDEHDVREGMRTLLVQQKCEVVIADSSSNACDHIVANGWVPDLIIADYRLRDDQTGDKAIDLVREEINEDVPAMIITGDTSPARLREAAASGFPLLHKPVIAEDLLDAITSLLGDIK